jgi:hypothetical protein
LTVAHANPALNYYPRTAAEGASNMPAREPRQLFRARSAGKTRLFFEQAELLRYPFIKRKAFFS